MAKQRIHLCLILLVVLALISACAAKPPAAQTVAPAAPTTAPAQPAAEAQPEYSTEGKVIYNVGFLKGHPVIRLMTLGFVLGAKDLGYEYKLLQSDGSDMNKMVQDLEQANAEGASAVVSFVSDPAMGPAVAALGKSGIPFCSGHFPQPEGQFPGMTAWASTETAPYAEAAAKAMGDELRKRGVKSGSIAITEGSFNTVENMVAEVFADTIKKNYPEFTPLQAQEEGFDPPPAIAKAAALIQANPDIVGALSTTGAGPTTWARAAEENGLPDGQIVIISMDYTRPNLDLVKEGKVFGLVGQPLVEEFRQCVHILDKVLRGEPYDYANPLPAPIITLKDIDTYYAYNDMVEKELGAGANAPATPAPEPTATAAPAAEAQPEYSTKDKVIYNVGFLKGHPVIRLMTLGFVLGAKDLGYEYKLLQSDGSDMNKMVQDLEQANAEGASAVVSFVSDPAMGPAVAALGKSGIPFCSGHFPQPEGQFPGMTAWASTETAPYAEAAAKAMGDELRKRGVKSGSIAITEGSFNTVENMVAEVFADTIKKNYPEFTPLQAQEEGFDPPPAIAKAAALIQANPDIVGALSTTGAGPTTWARAAEENGLPDGQIVIISMDYTRPNLDLVKEGKVFGLVGQPLVEEFRQCVHILDKVLRGEKYDYANPLPAPIITLKDIDTYYAYNDMVEKELGAVK